MFCSDVNATAALSVEMMPSGGNDLGGSKLGGLKINEWLQSRQHPPVQKSLNGALWESRPLGIGGRPMCQGKQRARAPWQPPWHGSKHPRKDSRSNAGKGLHPAAAHSKLQGLGIRANRQRDPEDVGLTHEFVGAKMTG
jgi:hypothetical protein